MIEIEVNNLAQDIIQYITENYTDEQIQKGIRIILDNFKQEEKPKLFRRLYNTIWRKR